MNLNNLHAKYEFSSRPCYDHEEAKPSCLFLSEAQREQGYIPYIVPTHEYTLSHGIS